MAGHDAPLSGPDLAAGVKVSDVPDEGTLLGHAHGESVVMVRSHGEVFAVGATCSHYGGPLAQGIVADGTIRCPWHHAAFDLGTGESLRPPALKDVSCWEVDVRDGVARVAAKHVVGPDGFTLAPRIAAHRASGRSAVDRRGDWPESVVILGGGAAGECAAETLRRDGYDRPIAIIEAGPDAPVDRPNLSKDYLAGTAPEHWIPLRPESFYREHGIELVLGRRAVSLDTHERRVVLDDGSARSFGTLLIATGATPVRLQFADAGQPVHYLRTLADSRAIVEAARHATNAVVIGASFIGLEVAASLRARQLPVTVVAPEWHPMERVLGAELGDFILGLHRDHGVDFRLGQTATAVSGRRVTTSQREHLRADLVVAGIGVQPNVELAERAGLAVDRGILVDDYLETTAPGVFAAGDVARYPDRLTGERIRVEHWVVAQRQGQAAARNILGARERFDSAPFFWSQHYDVAINYVGHAERWDVVVISGNLVGRDATVTYSRGGRVLATATVGRDQAGLRAERELESSLPHPAAAVVS
jgi:NADPH-dependent 2,4-dienoyl-CoA reductase/sulfur reductase-like enzyme/nitrite reductase/ring-hydroxylating ferredoxin subunit